MTEQSSSSVYDFESQLELGEMLLKLGRINEAELELRKARELNAAGSYTLADDDPQREAQLERLNAALERVEEVKGRSERNTRLAWIIGTSVLGLLLGAVTIALILGNNANGEYREEVAATIEAVGTVSTQYERERNILSGERTVYVENIKVYNVQLTESHELAKMGALASTQAAESVEDYSERFSTEVAMQVLTLMEGDQYEAYVSTPVPTQNQIAVGEFGTEESNEDEDEDDITPTLRPRRTPSSSRSDISMRLQVTSGRANFRAGPGFAFLIQRVLTNDDELEILGQSQDSFWYYVEAEDGAQGWLHASTSKPIELVDLPIIQGPIIPTAVPVAPTLRPTNTPRPRPTTVPTRAPSTSNQPSTNTSPANTNTPLPTAVPFVPTNTPFPTAVSPTQANPSTQANTPTVVIAPTNTVAPNTPTVVIAPTNTVAPNTPTVVIAPTNTVAPNTPTVVIAPTNTVASSAPTSAAVQPTNTTPPTPTTFPTNTAVPPANTAVPTPIPPTVVPTAIPPTNTPQPAPNTPLPTKTDTPDTSTPPPTAEVVATPVEVEFPPVATETPVNDEQPVLPTPVDEASGDSGDNDAEGATEETPDQPTPTPTVGLTFPPLTQP